MRNPRKIGLWSLTVLLVIGIIGGGLTWQHHQQKQRQPRIVATTYAVVQIADRLNLPLVGIPTTANEIPQRYRDVTKVGSPMNPSVEKITALKPTAVYSVTTLSDQFGKAFKAQHVTPHFLNLTSVAHLETTLTQLGKWYDRRSAAAKQVRKIQAAKQTARKRAQKRPAPRVLVIMGLPGASYMVATNRSYVGDLVRLAGGQNVFTSKTQEYMQPNDEAIQKANPQVILRLEHAMPKMVTSQFNQEFKDNHMWATTDAVKHHRVYDLQEPVFDATANMRVTTALDQVSHWLYPARGWRMTKHAGWWYGGVLVLLILTMGVAVMAGTTWIGPQRLLAALSQSNSRDFVTVFNLRLPRIISSLICGGSLAVAGALFQAVFRNPIADPSILGISSAADFFKLGGALLLPWLPGRNWLLGLIGGLVALWILTRGKALRDPYRLIIIGVALDATFVGLARLASSGQTTQVMASTFNAVTWADTLGLLVLGLCGLLVALLLAPWANYLKLADTALQTIGVPVSVIRWSLLLLGTYLAVSVTAIVGAIPFVGIVIPNLARRCVGHDYQTLLPFSMLAGAWLMLAADTLGRTVIVPSEISAATMMAVIGGPFVIILLQRGRGFHGITTG